MSTRYYICWYRLDELDSYLIWYGNEPDGVLTDQHQRVLSFPTISQARSYAGELGIRVEAEEPLLHDLDVLNRCLQSTDSRAIDCHHFLAAWNLFSDIASSVGDSAFRQEDRAADAIYNKLFEGNNLPSLRKPGELYIPGWSHHEVDQIERVLGLGLNLFRRLVIRQEAEPTGDIP